MKAQAQRKATFIWGSKIDPNFSDYCLDCKWSSTKKRRANIITVEICEWWKFCPCSGFGKCPNSVKLSQQRKCSNCGISNVISEMPIRKSHLILQHLSCKKCIRQDKWTDRQIDVQ
ncbi:hypothetical protein D917_09293 [Trichinella nativa]|uniref:Uncharacterized protein n=1 Tax=Trichinella nativa TaxID=6335 RepID=A0A1Y3EHL7_9BILA|nr:hypothetical protein D917_09293 [Trichinella nativa]